MKYVIYVAIVIVLIAGGWYFVRSRNASQQPADTNTLMTATTSDAAQDTATTTQIGTGTSSDATAAPVSTTANVREFTVDGNNYSFSPNTMTVKKGDTVRVTFKNVGGMHDWVLDEFNARTPRISSDKTAVVEFVADKVGTFEYYCSVGNHRAMGMKGTLTVTE